MATSIKQIEKKFGKGNVSVVGGRVVARTPIEGAIDLGELCGDGSVSLSIRGAELFASGPAKAQEVRPSRGKKAAGKGEGEAEDGDLDAALDKLLN